MAARSRCACGRVKSKYASRCKRCEAEHEAKRVAEALAIVEAGTCPRCGSALKRNLALTGWWQCEQYGAEQFRARADEPACEFQTFTC